MKTTKISVFLAMFLSGSAFTWSAAFGGSCSWAPDSAWENTHKSVEQGLMRSFDVDKNLILAQMTSGYQRLISAFRVDTSQRGIDGQRVSVTTNKAGEGLASVLVQNDVNRQILKAQADFGTDGLSVDPCNGELLENISSSIGTYKQNASTYMSTEKIMAASGSVTSPTEAIQKSLSLHKKRFCSPSEKKFGLCETVGKEASADVDIKTLFNPQASSEAKDAFVNNLVGLPVRKPNKQEAKTPEGAIMLVDAMRAEAARSPAIVSLAILRSQSDEENGQRSLNQSLDDIIDRYGGGEQYEKWYAELGTKNEKGLLTELNKIRSLEVKIRSLKSDSNTRISAMLASILAAESTNK